MRLLTEIKPLTDYKLFCSFNDGTAKTIDMKPLIEKEALQPLQDQNIFSKVVNKKYFAEWVGFDIDLSADTLWHLGI